jgi:hypothetical protein
MCFKYWSDTYHDTRTHYLMEQDPLPLQDQAGVMNTNVGDMWTAVKKIGALRGHAEVIWLSAFHVQDLWASRHHFLSYP